MSVHRTENAIATRTMLAESRARPSRETRKAVRLVGPSIAYIPLTRGLYALIDDEDAAWLEQWNWKANWSDTSGSFYADRNVTVACGRQTNESMHRALVKPAQGFMVDHRNRVTLDNRRANLREATRAQNAMNRKRRRGEGVRGVVWHKQSRRWDVRVVIDGARKTIGRFRSYEEAVKVRLASEMEAYGEFAVAMEG